jgi:hypothetical protein
MMSSWTTAVGRACRDFDCDGTGCFVTLGGGGAPKKVSIRPCFCFLDGEDDSGARRLLMFAMVRQVHQQAAALKVRGEEETVAGDVTWVLQLQ